MNYGFIQRAPRETDGRRADGAPKNVERCHRDLEALAFLTDAAAHGNSRALEAERPQRMRRDGFDALARRAPGSRRIHGKCRQALRAVAGGSRENDVEVSDACVGDPRFLPVDDIPVTVTPS